MAVFCHYEPASAQKQLNEGNKYFDRNMFEEAIPFYLKEIESGNPKFRNDAKEKLANCYRLTGQFLEASDMFKQILDKGSKNDKAENYLNYASSLKNAAKYEEAASIFKKYMELAPTDPMGKVYFESCMLAQQWLDREELYFVKNLEVVNSEESEYAPVIYKNGIVFSSARQDSKKKFINFSDNITEICSDLYYIDLMKSQEGQTEVLENLANLNSEQHDGTSTFSSDGTEVYFARTVTGSKNKKTNVILNSLQIFYSKQDMYGNWSIPVSAFSFNSQEYSIAQASLSRDGKKIYIASDMPGGYGKTDLYYCVKQSDDNWGDPINLGPKINTFGHELFPYIHGNDTLYFSSETHQGMGKLDIFMSVFANNEWSAVTNLGNPINSIGDDFGIVLDETQTRGFFSSDRFNGKGKEDIYTLNLIGPQTVFFNGHSIQFPDYTLYNGITFKITEEGANEAVTIASKDGFYTYPIKKEVNYTVNLRRDGFFYDSFKVRLLESSGDTCLNARIQAKTSSFVFGGVLSESNTKISSVSRLKPDSKKVYEIVNDTTVIESPIPEAEIFISRTQKLINKTFTNDQGFYLFPDTLKSGKEYAVLAIKPEKPEIIEEQLTQEQLSKKDSEIAPNNNPSGQPTPAGTTTNKGVPTTTQAGGQGTTNVATTGNQPAGQVAVNGTNGTSGTNQPSNTTSGNQPATATNASGQATNAGTTTNKGVPTTTLAGGQGTTNVATTGNQPAGQVAVNGTNGTNVANGTNQPANTTSSNQPATSTNAPGQPTTTGTTTNKGVPTTTQAGGQGTTNVVTTGNQPAGQVAANGTNGTSTNQPVNNTSGNQPATATNASGQATNSGTTTNKGVPTTTQAGGQGTTTGNQPAGQVAVNGTNGTNVANGTNQPANTTSSNQPATSTNASGQPTTAGTTTNKGVPTTSQTGVQGTTNGVASGNQPTGQVAVNGTNAMNQGVNLNVPNQSGNVTIPLQSEISNTNSELVSGNVVEVKRTIQNANGNKALEGCELKLYQGDQFIENVVSDSKGNVSLKLNEGKDYDLYVTKEGFFQTKIAIVAGTNPSKENIKINLAPIEKNKDIDLKNILFDFNKFNLRRESYSTLDRLADFLRKNPEVTIELNAHTDTRGDYYTNLILAYKRAEATREYLSAKGIQDARIFANGFGETFPIIKNAKTEPEHEQNRRVEMRIIENTGKNVSQTGFSVLSANPYSAEHPFPTGVPVPEGVIYRIKLGSYSKQVPFDTFKGVFPVVQEWDKNKELYSYYAGLFSNQEAAKNALSIVRNEVSEDVYVQAYINNTPVTNEELRKNLEAVSVLNQAESNKLQSTESGFPVFSIQIGAYRNPVKSSLKAEFKKTAGQYGLFVYEFMGNTIYTIGDFHEYTSAVNAMKLLDEKGLPGDAFIIGMINGKRIPVSEAIGIVERYESSKKSNFN